MAETNSGIVRTSSAPLTAGTDRKLTSIFSPSMTYSTIPDELGPKPPAGSGGDAKASEGAQTVRICRSSALR